MEIERFGGNCVTITTNKNKIITDPRLHDIGLKDPDIHAMVQILTSPDLGLKGGQLTVDSPGEYEISDTSIRGIAATAHIDTKEEHSRATIYRIDSGGLSLAVIGHVHPDLSEEQLEKLGVIDVVVLPVGGNGYTLDAAGAVQVVRKIEPRVVVPLHYAENDVHYPVPQNELEDFVNELGVASQQVAKLKLKPGNLPENVVVYELARAR